MKGKVVGLVAPESLGTKGKGKTAGSESVQRETGRWVLRSTKLSAGFFRAQCCPRMEQMPPVQPSLIIPPSTPVYADLATTRNFKISSADHLSIVERETKSRARPTPSEGVVLIWRLCLTRNQTSGSDPQSCQHLFLLLHKNGNPTVRKQLHLQ